MITSCGCVRYGGCGGRRLGSGRGPGTGVVAAERVELLHINHDTDLTLSVRGGVDVGAGTAAGAVDVVASDVAVGEGSGTVRGRRRWRFSTQPPVIRV